MKNLFQWKNAIMVISILALVSIVEAQEPDSAKVEEAKQYYSFGQEYLRQKNYEKAIESFSRSIELWPGYFSPYIALAATYTTISFFADAESTYSKAKQLFPDSSKAYEGLAILNDCC